MPFQPYASALFFVIPVADDAGMFGDVPTAGTADPTQAGMQKKALGCFPEVERAAEPQSIVPKAGVAIQKRLGKLQLAKTDVSNIIKRDEQNKTNGDEDDQTIEVKSLEL